MAKLVKLIGSFGGRRLYASSPSSFHPNFRCNSNRFYARGAKFSASKVEKSDESESEPGYEEEVIPSSGVSSRPLSEILKELNKRVPDGLVRTRVQDGFSIKYIPWHLVNRIMNLHAPEWSGEVRHITYSADGKSVSVVYRVTLYGVDAEMHRESIGTASVADTGYGDPVQKAEAMAFRRACARFGLGLHLYHDDLS
uniref:DNA repair RAD52-like protein 1, mitochondrial n=1 Tax=Kalanchoe fedtschenkoi TaxID=63787 RepID=A0A7N0U4H1_KALFE